MVVKSAVAQDDRGGFAVGTLHADQEPPVDRHHTTFNPRGTIETN